MPAVSSHPTAMPAVSSDPSAMPARSKSPARPLAVYISPFRAPWLAALPFEVAAIFPEPGVFDLPRELEARGLKPDCVIQDERLAPRVLLRGLEQLTCPKIFWSLDPHLNHYWQAPYAAQFDLTACTQKAWMEPLARAGTGRVEWLTWCEAAGPWRPHAQRACDLAFVGRIDEHRPLRRLFADFLAERFPFRLETDIPYEQMIEVYGQARLAPNQSIQGEITHRLFQGAAQGCVMVEPGLDNGLEELFTPGREVETYRDALELEEVLRARLRHPKATEAMGRAAWERHAREHQPWHRLQALGRLALECGPSARGGFGCGSGGDLSGVPGGPGGNGAAGGEAAGSRPDRGERLFRLAEARCLESGLLAGEVAPVAQALLAWPDVPECMVAALRLLAFAGQGGPALALALRLAGAGFAPQDCHFAVSGAALALGQGRLDLARTFLGRFLAATGKGGGRTRASLAESLPDSPAGVLTALGDMLMRHGALWRPGFPFDGDRHLPAAASECFFQALAAEPDNQALSRKCESLLRRLPGEELVRTGLLSDLSLRNPEDFRLGLALGIANLRAFRVAQGLGDLRLARELARSQGRGDAFEGMLAAQDRHGRIRAALSAG